MIDSIEERLKADQERYDIWVQLHFGPDKQHHPECGVYPECVCFALFLRERPAFLKQRRKGYEAEAHA